MSEIVKIDEDQRNVFGWASVAYKADGTLVIDKQNDSIPEVSELEDAAYDFVLHSREGDVMHKRVAKSTLIESIVFTKEKIEKLGLPENSLPLGWWVGFHVNDESTWNMVKSGVYKAFSVGGAGDRERNNG